MAWKFDNPLFSLSDEEQNDKARKLWEAEGLGGITEDNNRLPRPVVWLLGLTIISAFLMTFPLWGQRPQAAIYAEYVAAMDSPRVQAAQAAGGDQAAMAEIVRIVREGQSKYEALQVRHPLSMNELRLVKDQIIELQNSRVDLEEYTIVGYKVLLANFEGNWKADGTRERKQPWWDKGYTIDIFYVTYFCLAVMIAVKRLPNYRWQPVHHGH
ncbi:MAG: hypothetical protein LBV36_06800 [Chromatiales bacterium]|jgi:hypothetical protein|nr:hypothetical protein [Chromatiales bacterium]